MNVSLLKKLIEDLPDDMIVVIHDADDDLIEAMSCTLNVLPKAEGTFSQTSDDDGQTVLVIL